MDQVLLLRLSPKSKKKKSKNTVPFEIAIPTGLIIAHSILHTKQEKNKIKGSCFICLKPGHSYKNCRNKNKPCFHCKVKGHHNQNLCPTCKDNAKLNNNQTSKTAAPKNDNKSSNTDLKSIKTLMATNEFQSQLLLTVTTNISDINEKAPLRTRIILDCGSDKTHITKRSVHQLNFNIESDEILHVNVFGSTTPTVTRPK